jgi:hypothetical protein
MIYVCLTLSNSLNKNEEKATIFHINLVLKWLNLVFAISGLACISGPEVEWVCFRSYLTLPPNTIPRGMLVYPDLFNTIPTNRTFLSYLETDQAVVPSRLSTLLISRVEQKLEAGGVSAA